MFHWTDGWFFERDVPTGDVHIVKRATARDDAPVLAEAWIPGSEWTSIVATVSEVGETGNSWRVALALHGDVYKPYADEQRRNRGKAHAT